MEQQSRSDRPGGSRRHSTSVPGGAVGVHRASALDERGYGVMHYFLAIFAVLTGVLTWMLADAGLWRYRNVPGADWTELAPSLFLGLLTVLLAGLGLFAAKVYRQQADVAARIAQSPDRPWLHFAEWNQGRIQEAPAKQGAVVIGVFAAILNAIVIGVALLAPPRPDRHAETAFLVFLAIFGLAGLGLIALTVYMALAARKFSPAVFEMSGVPGVLGGWLRGTIQIPPEVPEGIEARVHLVCHRRATGSSRLDYDVWEEEVSARTSSSMPVAFRIPFNLPESDLPDMPLKGTMPVSWLLSISASLPGVDYSTVFNVPVFPTEASDASFVTGSEDGAILLRNQTQKPGV
jgi:hypothetical protein